MQGCLGRKTPITTENEIERSQPSSHRELLVARDAIPRSSLPARRQSIARSIAGMPRTGEGPSAKPVVRVFLKITVAEAFVTAAETLSARPRVARFPRQKLQSDLSSVTAILITFVLRATATL